MNIINFIAPSFLKYSGSSSRTISKQLQTFLSNEIFKDGKYNKYLNYVYQRTEVTTNHLTPEIKLHLSPPHAQIVDDFLNNEVEDIFWAFYWPGGQALSRYILDHPESVKNSDVVDIGCGCGATAIAAVMSGARQVMANDIDNVACTSVALNARLNNIQLEISNDDLLGAEDFHCDCILLGDMFYEQEMALQMLKWLEHLHEKGKKILIGDPGRISLGQHPAYNNLKLLAEYMLPMNVVQENRGFSHGCVWIYDK